MASAAARLIRKVRCRGVLGLTCTCLFKLLIFTPVAQIPPPHVECFFFLVLSSYLLSQFSGLEENTGFMNSFHLSLLFSVVMFTFLG